LRPHYSVGFRLEAGPIAKRGELFELSIQCVKASLIADGA